MRKKVLHSLEVKKKCDCDNFEHEHSKEVVTKNDSLIFAEMMQVLQALQGKVLGSKALNGGFDTLLFKIDKIEESQEAIVAKIGLIHDAIYHPDEGLFARVKDVENVKKSVECVDKLEKDVLILQELRSIDEKVTKKEVEIFELNDKIVANHSEQLKELITFKTYVTSIVKWISITAAGGSITFIGKLIYEFLVSHIIMR